MSIIASVPVRDSQGPTRSPPPRRAESVELLGSQTEATVQRLAWAASSHDTGPFPGRCPGYHHDDVSARARPAGAGSDSGGLRVTVTGTENMMPGRRANSSLMLRAGPDASGRAAPPRWRRRGPAPGAASNLNFSSSSHGT